MEERISTLGERLIGRARTFSVTTSLATGFRAKAIRQVRGCKTLIVDVVRTWYSTG